MPSHYIKNPMSPTGDPLEAKEESSPLNPLGIMPDTFRVMRDEELARQAYIKTQNDPTQWQLVDPKARKNATEKYLNEGNFMLRVGESYNGNPFGGFASGHAYNDMFNDVDGIFAVKNVERVRQPLNAAINKQYGTDIDIYSYAKEETHTGGFPVVSTGNSGVTFFLQYDLGAASGDTEAERAQNKLAELREAEVSDGDIEWLMPFLGKQGNSARAALRRNSTSRRPYQIPREVADRINEKIMPYLVGQVINNFNNGQVDGFKFQDLPHYWQSEYINLALNLGANGMPNFRRQLRDRDFDAALNNLNNFTGDPNSKLHQRARRAGDKVTEWQNYYNNPSVYGPQPEFETTTEPEVETTNVQVLG